jgi:hypothetical protein
LIAEIGGGIFSKRIVEQLNKKAIKTILITPSLKDINFKNKLENFPIIHFTGSPTVTFVGILSLLRFRGWGKKIVVSWIGFDIRRVKNNWFWRLTSKILLKKIDVNITDDEFVAKELNDVGIPARVQPLPIYSIYPLTNLPSTKQITIYLPDPTMHDFEHYQGSMIKKLVKEFSDVNFLITRNSGKFFKNEKNVKCILWIDDMKKIYENSLAVIRLPLHDATGATIIEALSMGRTMISSATQFPFCKIVNNYNELKQFVENTINNPKLNENASKFVHDHYNNSRLTADLIKICLKLI